MSGPASTRFSVAAHVLVYLAGAGVGRTVSSEELADSVDVTPVHIRRVLGPLRVAGLVTSRSGVGGGWQLARPATDIHLDAVWDAVPNGDVLPAHLPRLACSIGQHVRSVIDDLENSVTNAVRAELHSHTVADLVATIPAQATA